MQTRDTKDLMDLQIKLEEDMTNRGAERFLRDIANAKSGGREDGTPYGQIVLKNRLETLTKAIASWKEECESGKPGVQSTAYLKVSDMENTALAFMTLKSVLQGISSVRTLQYVSVTIGTAIEDEMRFSHVRDEERKAYDSIVMGAKKRTSYHYKRAYAIRRSSRVDEWDRWTRVDRLHVGMKMLDILMGCMELVEIHHQIYSTTSIHKYVKALPQTLEWIEKRTYENSFLRPVHEPMVVQPRDWTTPFDGGYISTNIRPLHLVKTSLPVLEELRHVDMPIVYAAVNELQRTAWQINSQVLKVMSELWDNGSTIAGMPPRTGIELPTKPTDIETNAEARKEYRIEAAKRHMHNLTISGKRVAFNFAIGIARRYEKYRRIFFPYQLDFRGRIYAVPHLNPQGPDYQKALLRFANGKPLGSEGWKWLAIHGANVAGNDKCTLEDRVNWVQDHEEEILAIAENPFDNRGWCTEVGGFEIDKPWQFLAFCFEWRGYCEHGDTFVSKIPIALDGSCSGVQHFSAMLRDDIGGDAVNLTPKDLPADVYQRVADKVISLVEHDAEHGTEDGVRHNDDGKAYVIDGTKTIAKQWLEFGITRKTCKRSVMTLPYGSKQYGFREQLLEDIINPARYAAEKDPTVRFPFRNDGYFAATYLAKKIWESVSETLIKASEAMKWLQRVASIAASEQLPVRWTTAVGFPVLQAYKDVTNRRVMTAISGKVVYLTMYKEKDQLDKRKQAQGIAPNFVHSCDAAHMMLTIVRASQEHIDSFAMIHDSFGTTAGDTEALFQIVRESFVELYNTVDVLGDFRDEIVSQLTEHNQDNIPEMPSAGSLDIGQVIKSRYCFA